MEASTRNSNRTNSRNDGAYNAFISKVEGARNYGFFYQYCNNKACREMTLLIMASPKQTNKQNLKAFQRTLDKTGLPGIVLEFPEGDRVNIRCLGLGVDKVMENQTWQQVIRFLHSQQLKHERRSQMPECANYTHEYLPKGTWQQKNIEARFSNEIRAVPGVRHIDLDGVMYCPDCFESLYLVEATSDGCPGTKTANKFKATTMTRKIAGLLGATPLMIQHFYEDDNLENPAYLTTWKDGTAKRVKRSWKQLQGDFERSIERHKNDCGT